MTGTRQVPHAEDLATGTPTAGTVPVSAGPGRPVSWGAGGGGGGGGGGGVWTQIDQHTVPAGGEGEFSFSTIPSTFDHLVVVGDNILLVDSLGHAASGDQFHVQPNAWDGSDYDSKMHRYGDVAHDVDASGAGVGIPVGYADATADWGAAEQAAFTLWIPGYAVNVPTRIFYGHGAKGFTNHVSWQSDGVWRRPLDPPDNTTVISTLRFVATLQNDNSAGNLFAEDSRFTLYGFKNGSGGLSAPSPYVKLAEVGPLGAPQATLRLPASGSLPTDAYDTYVVRAKVLAASGTRTLQLQFNDDTGANYNYTENRFDGLGSYGATGMLGDNLVQVSRTVESIAGYFAVLEAKIHRPRDTDNNKVVDFKTAGPTNGTSVAQVNDGIGVWVNTGSIVSVLLSLGGAGATFAAGSWAAVYGVRG